MERLGIVDDIRAERARILANVPAAHRARLLGRPAPYAEPKAHAITVNLKTGERTVTPVAQLGMATPEERLPVVRRVKAPAARALVVPKGPTAKKIIAAVARAWEVTPYDIDSAIRTHRVCHPRFAAYWLLSSILNLSTPSIGGITGGRDYSTVIHGLRRARTLYNHNPEWRQRYDAASAELKKDGRS